MHPEWESQSEKKAFLHLQKMSLLPTVLCILQSWEYRPALGRGSADRFWQAGVTSPGDWSPVALLQGQQEPSHRLWFPLFGQRAGERPLPNLCRPPRHTHSGHPPQHCQPAEKYILGKHLCFVFGRAGLPDHEVLSISSISTFFK